MEGRHRFLALAVLAVASSASPALGFECAALRPSKSLAPAYHSVPGHDRCEGFFERGVSQPFVELVSLTRGPAPAERAVSAPALELHADVRGSFRLVVQPQRSRPFYRTDMALQGLQPLLWDPQPMLAATRLPLADLGFVALDLSGSPPPGEVPRVAPVALTAGARLDARAYAVIRVSVDVLSVAWRSHRGARGSVSAWTDIPGSQLYAWRRLTVPLEMPADGKGMQVDVEAVGSDLQALPMLRFVILGPSDAARL